MKKYIFTAICIAIVIVLCCCSASHTLSESDIVGKWRCELYGSELIIEFTPDNRFISHTDGMENRYAVEDGYVITYVEGFFDEGIKLEAYVTDGVLTYGGVEYEAVK